MPKVAEAMRAKLTASLSPTHLVIEDDSARHAGHAGARDGGESHFNVTIESAAFAGLKPIERQRLVHRVLAEELAGPIHALSLKLAVPS
jgi:BolA family transcriptional regulator, general stress-responsive regulator